MRHLFSVAGLIALCLAGPGCQDGSLALPGFGRKPKPITDRLREAYPQLSAGRFVRVADFELPAQARLFRVESAEPNPLCRMTVLAAAPKTGGGSLVFRLNSETDALVVDNRDAAGWSMPRNWRSAEYPLRLMMMLVKSPRPLDGVRVEIRAGDPQTPPMAFGPRRLRAGWNLLEFDVDHADRFIDLSDVQQLRLSVQPLSQPVELYLDDVVLADNGRIVLAAEDPDGFEVRSAGTHLEVVLGQRFAIVFRDGLIADLYDLAADPQRTVSLADRDGLGPHWLPANEGAESDAPGRQPLESAEQRVTWATPGRVHIAAERRSAAGSVSLTYAVDRLGRVYWTASARGGGDEQPQLGRATFRVNPEAGLTAGSELPRPIETSGDAPAFDATLWSGAPPDHADLLSIVPQPTGPTAHRSGLLVVAWPETHLARWAPRMAADYVRPATMAFQTGWAVTTDAGDLDNDGFNETGGYYVVQMDENLLRFTVDGSEVRRFRPCFKVVAAADKECWAYAEGLLVRDVIRTDAGEFLFTLPIDVDRPMEIEVNALANDSGVGPVP